MDFRTFERTARRVFQEIPKEYREGVDGLTVSAERIPHPGFEEVYTLGLCLTEAYPSDWEGPDTLRSTIVLYHGSFVETARHDPGFDWKEEIWETITHEIRHHLESLAREDALEDVDRAMEEEFRRWGGEPFDPLYYRLGDRIEEGTGAPGGRPSAAAGAPPEGERATMAPGASRARAPEQTIYRVEYRYYLERPWTGAERRASDRFTFRWRGRAWSAPWPDEPPGEEADVHYLLVEGPETGAAELEVVLVRRRGLKERLGALFRGGFLDSGGARVLESECRARAE